MKTLAAFYFSGTGNTRYATYRLCEKLSNRWRAEVCEIGEEKEYAEIVARADMVLLAFPVYGSCPPIPMREFLSRYKHSWQNKSVVILATQYMFSGDGAAALGRTAEKFGARVIFAEHVNMPNNISDCKIFTVRNGETLEKKMRKADRRIDAFAERILHGRTLRRGFHPVSRAVGYFCQRLWWRKGEAKKRSRLRIASACTGCGLCAKNCPVGNLRIVNGMAVPSDHCVLCYRCVNLCPQRAVMLCGSQPPVEQYKGIPKKYGCDVQK